MSRKDAARGYRPGDSAWLEMKQLTDGCEPGWWHPTHCSTHSGHAVTPGSAPAGKHLSAQ